MRLYYESSLDRWRWGILNFVLREAEREGDGKFQGEMEESTFLTVACALLEKESNTLVLTSSLAGSLWVSTAVSVANMMAAHAPRTKAKALLRLEIIVT